MRIFQRLLLFFLTVIVASCNDVETGKAKNVHPDSIYFNYKIWGEEDQDSVTCMVQYRYGGPNGVALLLNKPSEVKLDGETLHADSTRLSGVYYEKVKPKNEFFGKHSIVFTDKKGKQFKENFEYWPLGLTTELTQQIHRQPFTIKLKNFPGKAPVTLIMIDTAFTTEDVNEIYTVNNSEIVINEKMLSRLKNGPIAFQLFKEEEKRIKNGMKEEGRITTSYGLKREFQLTE